MVFGRNKKSAEVAALHKSTHGVASGTGLSNSKQDCDHMNAVEGTGDVPRDDNSVGLIMVPLARRTKDSAMRAPTWVASSVSCALAPTDSTTHTPRDYNQST